MAFFNLFPIGVLQLYDSYQAIGTRASRLRAATDDQLLEWMRMPGDLLFIAGGVIPLLILAWRGARYARPATAAEKVGPLFTEADPEDSALSR